MVVHVAYYTLSVSVIAIISIVVVIFVSVIGRFVVAWLLSACIVDGQVITPSLLPTLVTSIGIVVSIGLVAIQLANAETCQPHKMQSAKRRIATATTTVIRVIKPTSATSRGPSCLETRSTKR